MLNVLLADDETRTLHHLMTGVPWFQLGMEVCCTASNGSEALAFIESHPIDILITDIRMPGMSGLELQERMKAQNLSLPIIFVTGHGDVPTAVRTLKLGAFDFLEKPVDAEALADAIEAASRVSVEASQGALPKQAVEQILAEMSPREHEITELLKQGLANHDIAERLDLSDRTVQGHRNNIYKKLRVHNLKQFLTVLEGG